MKQVGSGISVYSGNRYQNGNGSFLGKIIKYLKPALRYISRQGLTAASEMTKNLANGQNFKEAAKAQLLSTGENIFKDSKEKFDEIKSKQKGSGKRRKKSKISKKKVKKVKKLKSSRRLYKGKPIKKTKRKTIKKKILSIF